MFGVGEPTHQEPEFGAVRNKLFGELAGDGFGSITLETDRVRAMAVDDYVRYGVGTLDTALSTGFSHGLGELEPNRQLVAWMHDHNQDRPEDARLAFHGFDTPTEMMSAPSPLAYLEHVRDYLGVELDLASAAGADDRWSRTEAILDPAASPGMTADAQVLRAYADDLHVQLLARAPELVAVTSRTAWTRARTNLTAAVGLLRYHRQSAEQLDQATRTSRMLGVRDALMAENLLDISTAAPTLLFAHNRHLQRNPSTWRLAEMELSWSCAGSIVSALLGPGYTFIAGSLGASGALGLAEPPAGTYESMLRPGLVRADEVTAGTTRTDLTPEQGYFPLDQATVAGADAVLHLSTP
ncbi:erythromycin esterase family protein [Kribbella solani]